MTKETNTGNLEFYRDQYLLEHKRANFYDRTMQYPTALLVIFIGGVLYSYKNYFAGGFPDCLGLLEIVFLTLLGLFALSSICAIVFLSFVYHGFIRRYSHLPFAGDLNDHENRLFRHHYRYSDKKTRPEKIADAKENTCRDFFSNLRDYYINLTDNNQRINDIRASNYFYTRTFLFFDLLLFVAIGILGIIK
jgi:hypothetical protein